MKALLTYNDQTTVKGGTEVFSDYLRNCFSDLELFTTAKATKNGFSPIPFFLLREPLFAKAVQDYYAYQMQGKKVDVAIANGLYAWNWRALKRPEPLIVQLHGGFAPLAEDAYPHYHPDYFRVRYIYAHFESLSCQNAHQVVSNCRFTQKNAQKYYGVKSTVIDLPIQSYFKPLDKVRARNQLGWKKEPFVALYVGRQLFSKGFDIIVRLAQLNPNIHFFAIANGSWSTPLPSNLTVHSSVSHEHMPLYYAASDVLVFPSRFEGFGLAPLESLACGTPVIGRKTGILTDASLKGVTLLETEDVSDWNDVLQLFIHQNKPVSKNVSNTIRKRFNLKSFCDAYRKLVKQL